MHMAKKYTMRIWKELEIDNLPSDILAGGYVVEYLSKIRNKTWDTIENYAELGECISKHYKIRYRKSESNGGI